MKKILTLCLGGFLLSSIGVRGQSDSSFYQLGIEDLTKITVASNVVTQKEKQPVSITTITGEQLRTCGARVLSEALMMYVPGFFVVEDQDDLIAGFRGMAADNNSKVLLLINGQNLNTEFFWGPPDAILNSTNFEYIDRVEVIRGPGSVTLGQGALLGVINIVTKQADQLNANKPSQSEIVLKTGPNQYKHISADMQFKSNGVKAYAYLSSNKYGGQAMRNEGWIAQKGNEGFAGGKVFGMNHHLHRTNNTTMVGNIQYKGFTLNMVYADQTRDLYNFYRDRDVFQQTLSAFQGTYQHKFSSNVRLNLSASYAQDQFALHSLTGTTMGGTREDRFGTKAVLNIDRFLVSRNRLAVGSEVRWFNMGKSNQFNNNFIANVIGSFNPATANQELRMGYQKDISVASFFLEDFYSINRQLDVFFAVRNDNHPFWGNSFTPRLGIIYSVHNDLRFRASYQSGFRGAVGLHYTGGYRRDGFLRAESYGEVANANIPLDPTKPNQGEESNISKTLPERMNSIELAVNYKMSRKLQLEVVGFYNTVENVIDVGVIYKDPSKYVIGPVGNDVPGDWNGYWFFKNTPGRFSQAGLEASLTYQTEKVTVLFSHALVQVVEATEAQRNLAKANSSMYLSSDKGALHFKAYPENTTRMSVMAKVLPKLQLSATGLVYSKWYSPVGTSAAGGAVLNASASYTITKVFSVTLIAKNILGENALYPMNSNSGGPDVSSGTPAWESATYWLRLGITFN